ncbi:MAG: hypothetical protein ACKO11_07925, partial [Cuspidothrix sp.]
MLLTFQSPNVAFLRGIIKLLEHLLSVQHALNLMWNYPEVSGNGYLWNWCADAFTSDYINLCEYFNKQNTTLNNLILSKKNNIKCINISLESADSLYHISDDSLDVVITDPPYYGT